MQIFITKTAVKNMKRLDAATRERIICGINKLPLGDVKRLQGYTDYYRLRVGDFRVIYSSDGEIITVMAVLPRGEAYKNL
ncbi:MAG: type II toxin-antitoxin system RelE/ParE family toxin [Oscillospiraceae bacterium]|nr:type II toxin-antitoxin system RelE/ParE family toxin [Oscillospiraceae bacterium]